MKKIKSYSKINISLLVGKKRKNNLHKIKSFFLLNENLYDEIQIEESSKNEIIYIVDGKEFKIENCILLKTINYLNNKFNLNLRYKIKVTKNIPIGSGLGGASSNAASLINFLIDSNLISSRKISKWISEIGSDVYFFLKRKKFAFVYSYGNKILHLKKPKINFELFVNKDINCSTKDVYHEFDKIKCKKKSAFLQYLYIKLKCYNKLINDLQEPCFNLYKNLKTRYDNLKKENTLILSGSGSSFVILKGEHHE